jgi:transmembrane sensor
MACGGAVLLGWGRHRVRTVIGERRTLQLPDGSSAVLNTDTRISWSFDGVRALWLEQGEVAVMVVEDAARPFMVYAGGLVGRLQQGRYNVRLGESGPRFLALAGQGVIAGHAASPVRLQPLQAVVANKGGPHADAMSGADARDLVAWQSGEIIFRGMPLDQAAAEFNRYLQRKIVVDPSVASIRLGGRFQVDDLPSFLASLQGSFGIHVQASDRGYLLTAA